MKTVCCAIALFGLSLSLSAVARADSSKTNTDKKTADQKAAADAAQQKNIQALKVAAQASDATATT